MYKKHNISRWSEEEEDILLDWTLSDEQVAEILNRPLLAVLYKRQKLKDEIEEVIKRC